MSWAATRLAAVMLAVPLQGGVGDRAASYLERQQQPDGGFAEPGGRSDPVLTAWAVLGLKAAGRKPGALRRNGNSPADYLSGRPYTDATDLALRVLALRASGESAASLVERLEGLRRRDGRIGPLVNSTAWGVLALRAAGMPAGARTVRYLARRQTRSGGWSWHPRGAPDSNDTAAAIQALRAAGVRGTRIRRGLRYLRRCQNRDGGFALARGRPSDAQSTAWSIQAFLAAGRHPGRAAYRYLRRLRRPDGSFRYSRRYAISPVWVTAQVLPALAGKPFPLH